MRVVSLNCSNTEILAALGCAPLLVGVGSDSDYPEEVVEPLPRLGRDLNIEVDRVVELEPDLVLASDTVPGHDKVLAALEAANLPYFAPETVSLEGTFDDIVNIAIRLGVEERGHALVEEMKLEMPYIECAAPPSILVQWWPKPVIAPGRMSWVHDLLELAGARSPLGELAVKSQPLDDAQVTELAPNAVVISWCGVKTSNYRPERILQNPAWQDLDFVRKGRVYCVPEAFLGRPGPRLVEGYRQLRDIALDCLRG